MPRRAPLGPVRRSTRIRHKISPYFKVNSEECRLPTEILERSLKTKKAVDVKARQRKASPKRKRNKKAKTGDQTDPPPIAEAERVHGLARQVNFYGLIQELVTPNVFRLLVATCLLNQTKGRAAMPVFWDLLGRWPDEHHLAKANVAELTDLLQPIGLHNVRARRLISMAQVMVEIPYDESNSFKSRDRTAPDTPISIYPGVGRYAIDSWRIFVAGGGASAGLQGNKPVSPFDTALSQAEAAVLRLNPPRPEAERPEWKSVMPLDKELRAYLIWRWAKEGKVWDPLRGLVSTE
ncbi:hypothetical protein EX895_002655 [Sporisorium graminicola]|uniref:HhH-GPD domain-containing protein n=1 Tax=Sporisorium graminicola TaxID=280036 RepID=A0A4U7KUT5_9BASI|nr:hypothetical protein EX895_002655 [Sporisorium graminicola]TKY88303.1 hypothetical protein EX895_002655 [Sporisorium graminicola]